MTCANGHGNPEGAKFCGECGAAIVATAPPVTPTLPPRPPPPSPPTLPPRPRNDVAAAGGQAAGTPVGPPPPVWPAGSPVTQPVAGQTAADGLATVRGLVAKVSVTAGLLYGGLVFAAIGIFLPWGTATAEVLGQAFLSHDISVPGWLMFVVVLMIAAAAWLAWPALSGSSVPNNHRIGLTVVVGLLVGVFVIGVLHFLDAAPDKGVGGEAAGVDLSVGSGLVLYPVAVIAIAGGVVRLWMHRSKTM